MEYAGGGLDREAVPDDVLVSIGQALLQQQINFIILVAQGNKGYFSLTLRVPRRSVEG